MRESKKRKAKKYLIYVIISCCTLLLGIILTIVTFPSSNSKSQLLYSYEITRDADYKVYINENNYYDNNYLEENATYISDLVNNINIDFKYKYNINKNADFEYTYKIINEVVIESDSANTKGGTLYSKQYELLSPVSLQKSSSSDFVINQNIIVDYNRYNWEVKKYAEQYKVPIKAHMNVKLLVNATANINDMEEIIADESIIQLNMDLMQDTFKIAENYEKTEHKDVTRAESIVKNKDKDIITKAGIIIAFASIVCIALFYNKYINSKNQNYYRVVTDKLLKKYEEIIAKVVNPVDIGDKQVVDVKNFQQLLEIENEIRIPILFYETIPNEEGEFIIINENIVYRYIINGKA